MLLPMAKVHIIGHKACLDQTLATLSELGVLQIENVGEERMPPLPAMALDADRLRQREEARFLLARVEALLSVLPAVDAGQAASPVLALDHDAIVAALRAELDTAEPEIQRLARQYDDLLHEQQSLPRYQAQLTRLLPLTPELTELEGYETVAMLLDRRYSDILGSFEAALAGLTQQQYVVVSTALDGDTTGALAVFPRAISAEVHQLLGHEQVTQVRLPPELSGMSFQRALSYIEKRLATVGGDQESIRLELQEAARRWRSGWINAAMLLRDKLAQLEVINWLGETERTFLLVGWVPKRALPALRDALREAVGESIIIEQVALGDEELKRAPVLMENPAVTRPFEFLIRLLSLPKYGTIDPTSLMALFMPLFFGMMLGDVAYGLLVVGLALWAERRFRHNANLRDLSRILGLGGAWAVLFGFIYGEFLGTLGPILGLHPLWKSREDPTALPSLLVLTIVLGACHVTLGLILGIWQARRQGHVHQLEERAGMLVGLIAICLLIAVAARQLPRGLITPAIAGLLVGVALLARAQWPSGLLMAPVEMLGVVGNVLSYLRIAAIGLSSVYLARVGNEMAGLVGNVWLGVIIAALFNALNLALGAFSPTIQALRLHYVEFFSKFYEEGGRPFSPFGGSSTTRYSTSQR